MDGFGSKWTVRGVKVNGPKVNGNHTERFKKPKGDGPRKWTIQWSFFCNQTEHSEGSKPDGHFKGFRTWIRDRSKE